MNYKLPLNKPSRKTYPKQVGDALRVRLDLVSSLEKRVEQLTKDHKHKDEMYSRLNNQVEIYRRLEMDKTSIEQREISVAEREKTADLDALRLKLSEERRMDFQGIVRDVFRNQELLISRTSNRTLPDGNLANDNESKDHTKL